MTSQKTACKTWGEEKQDKREREINNNCPSRPFLLFSSSQFPRTGFRASQRTQEEK